MGHFARRLGGFGASSLPFLSDRFLTPGGVVADLGESIQVRLPAPPLLVVLALAGLDRTTVEVPWLPKAVTVTHEDAGWCVPGSVESKLLDSGARHQEARVGRRGYPPQFRRKVLDLLEEGRSVAQVAHDLDISDQSIYAWRHQDRIDKGLVAGLTSKEKAELASAKKRIADLETELAVARRAVELLREEATPKGGSRRSR
nr:transposase [Actinopolymorpha cephalotaxi]